MTHRFEYLRGPAKADNLRVTKLETPNLTAEALYANQAKLAFDDTPGSYVVGTAPANSVLEYAVVKITTNFNSTLDLGNASNASAYIANASFTKTAGMAKYDINVPFATATAIKLAVGAATTTGAGTIWLVWRLLA